MPFLLTLYFTITLWLARTGCVPVRNPYLQELCSIASQPCVSEGREGYAASPAMQNVVANLSDSNADHLLVQLIVDIQEAIENASNFYNNTQGWVSYVNRQDITAIENAVKIRLHIPLTNHSGLSQQQNSRLHALLQYINYAVFIKQLDSDSSAFGSNVDALRQLRFKIQQASCTLRRLLPQLSAADLVAYAEQDLQEHFFTIGHENNATKRVVCCVVVNLAQQTFNHTEVNMNTRSIVISGDL